MPAGPDSGPRRGVSVTRIQGTTTARGLEIDDFRLLKPVEVLIDVSGYLHRIHSRSKIHTSNSITAWPFISERPRGFDTTSRKSLAGRGTPDRKDPQP